MTAATATNPKGDGPLDKRAVLNLFALAARGHATTMTVFLRRGFGKEALGANGVAGLVVIVGYAMVTGCQEMWWVLCAYLLAVACQRIYSLKQEQNGEVAHSRYAGYPEVGMRWGKTDKIARQIVEPLVCMVIGALFWQFSEELGTYFLIGPFSLLISLGLDQQLIRNRVQAMRDAQIETQFVSDVFNGRREQF